FGFSPAWAEKRMYLLNARAEGDRNKENDPKYTGELAIVRKPAFRQAMRKGRWSIPADVFIEGPEKEKLNTPYVVYLINKVRPFGFAGIYEDWQDKNSGERFRTFAILTTTANALLQQIGHPRMPVILDRDHEGLWLDGEENIGDVLRCIRKYPSSLMNAYPVSPAIKKPGANEPGLLTPIGERLLEEAKNTSA